MSLNEFDIIAKYFTGLGPESADVSLGIGDDCALITPPSACQLAVTVDNLVLDRHFDAQVRDSDVAYKAIAVSVSDLAAMGATPRYMTLALTLPASDERWLQGFSAGLQDALEQYGVSLIGGNLTRGPLNIATQLLGYVESGRALKRSGANPGDHIFVSGRIGEAALGLALHKGEIELPAACLSDRDYLVGRWYRPQAQVLLGQRLIPFASACIDVSDGLLADLSHLLASSGVGAEVELQSVPVYPGTPELTSVYPLQKAYMQAVSGGEDYQLCFTVPPDQSDSVQAFCHTLTIPICYIGEVEQEKGLRLRFQGELMQVDYAGYQHFSR